MSRWFGPPRGAHRVPAPGTLLSQADAVRAQATAPATVRMLPVRTPGATNPPTAGRGAPPPAGDLRRVRDNLAELVRSPVRDGVQVTARASSFRFPLRCFTCGREHGNTNADRFADLYASAAAAGWQQDLFGSSWRCPRCARRHNASFGVRAVAAIEPAAPGGK